MELLKETETAVAKEYRRQQRAAAQPPPPTAGTPGGGGVTGASMFGAHMAISGTGGTPMYCLAHSTPSSPCESAVTSMASVTLVSAMSGANQSSLGTTTFGSSLLGSGAGTMSGGGGGGGGLGGSVGSSGARALLGGMIRAVSGGRGAAGPHGPGGHGYGHHHGRGGNGAVSAGAPGAGGSGAVVEPGLLRCVSMH